MKKQILIALTLVIAPGLGAAPAISAVQPQSGSLTAIGVERAVAEFEHICLSLYPNPNRFDHAMANSDFAYRRVDGDQTWRSAQSVVSRVAAPGQSEQCNFDAALGADDSSRQKVVAAIEAGLAGDLGATPPRLVFKEGMKWEWQMKGVMHSVTYYFGPTVPERQLALTYRIAAKGQ